MKMPFTLFVALGILYPQAPHQDVDLMSVAPLFTTFIFILFILIMSHSSFIIHQVLSLN